MLRSTATRQPVLDCCSRTSPCLELLSPAQFADTMSLRHANEINKRTTEGRTNDQGPLSVSTLSQVFIGHIRTLRVRMSNGSGPICQIVCCISTSALPLEAVPWQMSKHVHFSVVLSAFTGAGDPYKAIKSPQGPRWDEHKARLQCSQSLMPSPAPFTHVASWAACSRCTAPA